MNLNRRIEKLEKFSPSASNKVYVIVPKDDESPAEARQRYCKEENVTEADLEIGKVFEVTFVSPGDLKKAG